MIDTTDLYVKKKSYIAFYKEISDWYMELFFSVENTLLKPKRQSSSVVTVSWFTRYYCACTPLLYISELCEDCAVANEIDYEIDDAWTNIHGIHDNGHVITACDVWL